MPAKILPFPARKPARELLRILVPENTVTVRCPRKGPLGAEISIIICEQLHSAKPEACQAEGCNNAAHLQAAVAALKKRQVP